MRNRKRIMAALLSGSMVLSLTPPLNAYAAETVKVKVTKTDIRADQVRNNEGYGVIALDRGDSGLKQHGLIDRNGEFIFPYTEGAYSYSVNGGIVTYGSNGEDNYNSAEYKWVGDLDDYDSWDSYMSNCRGPLYYNLDGSLLFEKLTFRDLSEIAIEDADDVPDYAYAPWYGSTMNGGYANVGLRFGVGYEAMIDATGTVVCYVPDPYDSPNSGECRLLHEFGDNGWIAYFASDADDVSGLMGYLDAQCEEVLNVSNLNLDLAYPFRNGTSVVGGANGKYGAIDMEGKFAVPLKYADMIPTVEPGEFIAKQGGKYGVINQDEEILLPFSYDAVYGWFDGIASVVMDDKCGLVDSRSNSIILPLEYDDISGFTENVAYAVKHGELYIITRDDSQNTDKPEPEKPDEDDNKVISITVTPSELSMKAREKKTLSYTSTPSDAEKISVTWYSTDSKVASVDQEGTVTAVKKGTAEIYCVSKGEKKVESNHCVVTVTSSGSGISGGIGGGIGGSGIGGSGGGSGSSGGSGGGSGSSGGSSGGSSSGGSSSSSSRGSGPAGGNASLPSYVTRGSWAQAEDGAWKFTDSNGNTYANVWAAVENQYANTAASQQNFDWFRFDENGKMLTGWFYDQADGHWYYLNPISDGTLGKMMTGWVVIDGAYYYFNENSDGSRGRMYVNETTPDGYQVDGEGRWIQ